jgi:hypothetical protein
MQQTRDLRGAIRNKSAQHNNQGNGLNGSRKTLGQQDEYFVYMPPPLDAGTLWASNYQSYQRF